MSLHPAKPSSASRQDATAFLGGLPVTTRDMEQSSKQFIARAIAARGQKALPFYSTSANGQVIALAAKDEAQVGRLYDIALANGGTDEGAPGDRGGGFYAAYFRDLDGNKLNAFVMAAPE